MNFWDFLDATASVGGDSLDFAVYPWQRRMYDALFPPRTWRGSKSMGVRMFGHALYLKRLDRVKLYYSERNAKLLVRWGRLALVLRLHQDVYARRRDQIEAEEESILREASQALLRFVRRRDV